MGKEVSLKSGAPLRPAPEEPLEEGLVWYVGYGSNLYLHRFMCYLRGWKPTRKARRHNPCPDGYEVRGDEPFILPFKLYFACSSPGWYDGGVAFVDPEIGQFRTYGRAFLITVPQLRHVALEENGGEGEVNIAAPDLVGKDIGDLTRIRRKGWYDHLIACGEGPGGNYPAVALTGMKEEILGRDRSDPSRAYIDRIRKGLIQLSPILPELATESIKSYIRESKAAFRARTQASIQ